MALTRRLLESMGLESDKISSIIEAHSETVEGLKSQIDKYKTEAEKLSTTEKELSSVQAELESIKTTGGDWQKKYEEEHSAFESYKTEIADAKALANKSEAYSKLLKAAGVSEASIDAVIKVTDLGKVEMNDDGTIKDADKLTEGIKTEWAGFITSESIHGANTITPPGNDGNKPDLDSLDMADYIKARSGK